MIIHLPVVDSTQDEAGRRIRAGEVVSGTLIMADNQTKGRGRQGRAWETATQDYPTGNLAATLCWALSPNDQPGDYGLITAVALAATVAQYLVTPEDLKIKWPNDLMLGGQKCAGILIEAPEPGWLLIGTGVNIAYAPGDRAKLADFAKMPVDVPAFAARYLAHFDDMVTAYRRDGMGKIVALWMALAYGLGQMMTVRLPREEFTARFDGLAADGACLATPADGQSRRVYAGDVFF